MGQAWRELMRHVDRLSLQEWSLVLIAAIIVGSFWLRGFGSRSNY